MSSKIITEKDFPLNEIFAQILANNNQNFSVFSQSNIDKEYLYHRKNIFNILHKITNKMGFKSQVFYLSANYLDIIFSSKKIIKYEFNIYTLALACFCLSAKFCEIDPIVPQLNYFIKIYYNIIGYKIKNPISLQDLKYAEVYILKLLNYKLNYYTIYDFNSFLFIHGLIQSQQKNNNCSPRQIMEKIYKKSRYYLDLILINTKLCFKYNTLFISIFILERSIKEVVNKKNKNICFKEIMKNMFNINYEDDEQYQRLIMDEEIEKIFGKNGKDKNKDNNVYNITNKKFEEKNECNDSDLFNKTFFNSNKKLRLNFDINKLKEIYQKIDICKSISKEKNHNKTSKNFYAITSMKKENRNPNLVSITSRNELDDNTIKYSNKNKGSGFDSQPKIIYSKYTYNGNNIYYGDKDEKPIKKNKNSSVKSDNKNICLNKYILTSHKKVNQNTLKSTRKSCDDNKNNKTLYQKKLIYQNLNENFKTISSFMDDSKNKITYGIINLNSKEKKKETSIEHKNKNELNSFQKINFFKKINYKRLINNVIIDKTSSLNKNNKNTINNISNFNKIDKTSKNKITYLNINNFKNMNESAQTITSNSLHLNIKKELNISKDKTFRNFNIHKYQKYSTKTNQNPDTQKRNNPPKNKLSFLLGKQNTNLHNTLKEINIANANKKRAILNKDKEIISTLPNREIINFFKTQKNNFYKIKQDKKQEEIYKNQQDVRKDTIPNPNHEKMNSSSILIKNNISFNQANKNMIRDSLRYNNIYKKNKILDMKSKNSFNINNRNTVNGFNDTFFKSHVYTKTLENDFVRKRF